MAGLSRKVQTHSRRYGRIAGRGPLDALAPNGLFHTRHCGEDQVPLCDSPLPLRSRPSHDLRRPHRAGFARDIATAAKRHHRRTLRMPERAASTFLTLD